MESGFKAKPWPGNPCIPAAPVFASQRRENRPEQIPPANPKGLIPKGNPDLTQSVLKPIHARAHGKLKFPPAPARHRQGQGRADRPPTDRPDHPKGVNLRHGKAQQKAQGNAKALISLVVHLISDLLSPFGATCGRMRRLRRGEPGGGWGRVACPATAPRAS